MPFIFIIRLRRIAIIFIEVYRATTVSLYRGLRNKIVCSRLFIYIIGAADFTVVQQDTYSREDSRRTGFST